MTGLLQRSAYAAGQAARVGVYFGQYWLSARMTTPVKPRKPIEGPFPTTGKILADLRGLLERDWANIAAGRYRVPHDLVSAPLSALRTAPGYFRDLQEVERRRHSGSAQEVARPEGHEGYPRYYLQNFHYQTGGWFGRESARLYDHQVEILFGGGADAMRRMALVPLGETLARRGGSRGARLLDMASGTGRFLTFVKDNHPRLHVTALDLSPDYLQEARESLKPWRGVNFVQAQAEATGLPDAAFDAITCVYLFHELPRKVRREVAAEAFRLLKPGGRLILVDSIQLGDNPEYDGLLDYFPVAFHEPYYADYVRSDLPALFEAAGLRVVETEVAYFSRVMTMEKPS